MKKILKNITLFILGVVLSYLVASYLLYKFGRSGFFIIYEGIAQFIFFFLWSYIVLIPILFTTFAGKGKYWWIGALSIPALVFFVYFDFEHIYFPIILGLAGWGIGLGILRVFKHSRANA